MAKNKNKKVSTTATAGSSRSKEDNLNTLVNEVAESRKEIDRLRSELDSLSAAINSENKEIEKLKTLNNQLVTEMVESRKQIDQLRFELASLATDQDILASIERDVIRLVLSSSLDEAAASNNANMAAMMKKADSAAAELMAAKMRLLALARGNDTVQMDMEIIHRRSSEQNKKAADQERGRRFRKKCIYPVAVGVAVATASLCVAAAVVKGFNRT